MSLFHFSQEKNIPLKFFDGVFLCTIFFATFADVWFAKNSKLSHVEGIDSLCLLTSRHYSGPH